MTLIGTHLFNRALNVHLPITDWDAIRVLFVHEESNVSKQTSRCLEQHTPFLLFTGFIWHACVDGQESPSLCGPQLTSLPFNFRGSPTRHVLSITGRQMGIIGQGRSMHSICTSSQRSALGQVMSRQGSRQVHVRHPLSSNR